MDFLLLVAHGSRKEVANREVRDLAAKIEKHDANTYQVVIPVFLEFAKPDIGGGVDHCANLGAKSITVVPYFLAAGNHVVRDVPGQLKAAKLSHPEINIHITQHFGASDSIVEAIIDCASSKPAP